MAQKVDIYLVDDLDGETRDGVMTVEFGLDGKTYEIDLSDPNAAKLRDELAPFVASARRVRGTPAGRVSARTVKGDRVQLGAAAQSGQVPSEAKVAREWLRANGYKVNDRGRLTEDQWDIYRRRDTLDGDHVEDGLTGREQDETWEKIERSAESPAPKAKDLANGELAQDYVANAVPVADPFEVLDLGDPELDAKVKAWHEAKGLKIPANGKVNSVMRKRYQKAHEAA